MDHSRRIRYLDAMGIETYVRRGLEDVVEAVPSMEKGTDPFFQEPMDEVVTAGEEKRALTPLNQEKRGLSPFPDSSGWDELQQQVRSCKACNELVSNRTQTVFGVGNSNSDWLIIGEAPGADEDRQGEPFVGRAGQLLNAMLLAIGLPRDTVYIANILKCRPPGNRDPKLEETVNCESFLLRQIDLIKPKLILSVGRISAQTLLQTDSAVGRLRGRVNHYGEQQIPLVVTYHPAYLLRSPEQKAKSWEDLKLALATMKKLQ